MIQLALGFVTAHPAVTSAIIGPRTFDHLHSQLAAADTAPSSQVLDAIVAPGVDLVPEEKFDTHRSARSGTAAALMSTVTRRAALTGIGVVEGWWRSWMTSLAAHLTAARGGPHTRGMLTYKELLGGLRWSAGTTVLAPQDSGPGSWVGGPSTVVHGGVLYLAYRKRRPIGAGRGFANVIARTTDGVTLETLAVIARERHRTDSLERPCLVRLPDDRWRLYISCSTPDSKHWRVDLLEAATIQDLPDAAPQAVLPGDQTVAVKDPVILFEGGCWHLWASCHPLQDPDATDRMSTEYATSRDGVTWQWHGTALAGTSGSWDARGVRFSAVVRAAGGWLAFYDGRATAQENWEERTGVAVAPSLAGPWKALAGPVMQSPWGMGGLRYLSMVPNPAGGRRVYYECTRPDGSHELRTQSLQVTED